PERARWVVVPVLVGEMEHVCLAVVERHVNDVGLEGLAHLLADEMHEGIELQLRDECSADVVYRIELFDALLELRRALGDGPLEHALPQLELTRSASHDGGNERTRREIGIAHV